MPGHPVTSISRHDGGQAAPAKLQPSWLLQQRCSHLGGRVLGGWSTSYNGQDVAPEQHLNDADAPIVEASTKLQRGTVV
jgi:hypothetical protein